MCCVFFLLPAFCAVAWTSVRSTHCAVARRSLPRHHLSSTLALLYKYDLSTLSYSLSITVACPPRHGPHTSYRTRPERRDAPGRGRLSRAPKAPLALTLRSPRGAWDVTLASGRLGRHAHLGALGPTALRESRVTSWTSCSLPTASESTSIACWYDTVPERYWALVSATCAAFAC